MEKLYNRYYIKIRCQLGISTVEIHRELKLALGDFSPSYQTVARWAHYFKDERESTEDDPRLGRPVTTCTKQNIDQVRQLIDRNPHISYNQIEAEASINKCIIREIIHSHLKMRKIASRWGPRYLNEKNRKDRVNICIKKLAIYRDGPGRLCDILTRDKTWFYLTTNQEQVS